MLKLIPIYLLIIFIKTIWGGGGGGSLLAKNCKKTEFIVVIGTVQSYLAKWGESLNFNNDVVEIARKIKCVKGERKLNFGNEITEILVLPVLPSLPMKYPKCMLGGVLEMETNCGNDIAENGREKKKKELWQLSCRKWRGKKKMLRP